MMLAFVILADYQFENLGTIASDIYLLTVVLYLIVFAKGFVEIVIGFQKKSQELNEIENQQKLDQKEYLIIKSNRQNINLEIKKIVLIESLADYVQIHTGDNKYITKERISSLEKNLPERFIRIHRSFIVNAEKVKSFNKESVTISEQELTFGRKFKADAFSYLSSLSIAENTNSH